MYSIHLYEVLEKPKLIYSYIKHGIDCQGLSMGVEFEYNSEVKNFSWWYKCYISLGSWLHEVFMFVKTLQTVQKMDALIVSQ